MHHSVLFEQYHLHEKRWAASTDTRHFRAQREVGGKKNPPNYIYCGKGLGAQFQSPVVCLTSGERRVQLLVEEPLLPVLLLLSDIAPWWLNAEQHGADSAAGFCRRTQEPRVIIDEHRPEAELARHNSELGY